MLQLSNKFYLLEKKNNFGIINNNNGLSIITHILKKFNCIKNNLIIIPYNLKNIIKIQLKNKNCKNYKFYKKNINYMSIKNLIITDKDNIEFNNIFNRVFLYNAENLKIPDINFNYTNLWFITDNPDLIYFNNKNYIRNIINDLTFKDFEKYIISKPKKEAIKLNIINKSIDVNLEQYLNTTCYDDIQNNTKYIIKKYNIKENGKDECSICYNVIKLVKINCCNQNICYCCYFKNYKKYKRCPYCRYKYNDDLNFNIKKHKNAYIFIYPITNKIKLLNLNHNYRKVNLNIKNIKFVGYINNLISNNNIITFNLNNNFIQEIINKYFIHNTKTNIYNYIQK